MGHMVGALHVRDHYGIIIMPTAVLCAFESLLIVCRLLASSGEVSSQGYPNEACGTGAEFSTSSKEVTAQDPSGSLLGTFNFLDA